MGIFFFILEGVVKLHGPNSEGLSLKIPNAKYLCEVNPLNSLLLLDLLEFIEIVLTLRESIITRQDTKNLWISRVGQYNSNKGNGLTCNLQPKFEQPQMFVPWIWGSGQANYKEILYLSTSDLAHAEDHLKAYASST